MVSRNGSHGINIYPAAVRNHLEENQVQDNGLCGINFGDPGVGDHIYRNNTLRSNPGGGVCGGGGTITDAGGNIL